jgi:rRNA-processing protein FCF1
MVIFSSTLLYCLTKRSLSLTMYYMKLLMDADCLIKLTKAGLKEMVAEANAIFIPAVVKKEVVDTGKNKGCADSVIVEDNIAARKINVVESTTQYLDGDEALLALFQRDKYDAVATDDTKLVRKFGMRNIPHILPALLLYRLWGQKVLTKDVALSKLQRLEEFISEEEYSTVRLLLERQA